MAQRPPMPTPPAPAQPAGAPSQPLFPENPFNDVSQDLPRVWQMIDVANRILKQAKRTGGLYGQPEALAQVDAWIADIDKAIVEFAKQGRTISADLGSTPTARADDVHISPAGDNAGDAPMETADK